VLAPRNKTTIDDKFPALQLFNLLECLSGAVLISQGQFHTYHHLFYLCLSNYCTSGILLEELLMKKDQEKRDRMQAEDFVREARSTQPELPPPQLLQLVIYQEKLFPDAEESSDQNAVFRASVIEELYKTLSSEDHSLICFLLKQEIEYHTNMWGVSESIRLCGFLLFVLAQIEDVCLLWEAKTTNFDTMCGLDIQCLVGAGVSPTLDYLQHIQEEWAQDARIYIEECQEAGDFRNLERYHEAQHVYFR
jgi:hypothetical protein